MSFLFFKTPGTFLRKEAVSTPHKLICKEQSIIGAPKEALDTSSEVKNKVELCMQLAWEKFHKPSECGQRGGVDVIGSGYPTVWKEPPVDELVSKLVARISLLPEVEGDTDSDQCVEVDAENEDFVSIKPGLSNILVEQSLSSQETWPSDANENVKVFEPPAHLETHCTDGDVKLKSVIRGGYEKLGKGPRPKLHVTWAPDVYDPPCTSSSHTVSQSNRKHHYPKHDKKSHKSKSSNSTHNKLKGGIRGDSRKKLGKNLSRKPRQADEASVLSQTIAAQRIRHSTHHVLAWALDNVLLEESWARSTTVKDFVSPDKRPVLFFTEGDFKNKDLRNSDFNVPSET